MKFQARPKDFCHDPASVGVRYSLPAFPRQALHAYRLTIRHPVTEEIIQRESALPEDMEKLLLDLNAAADGPDFRDCDAP